jgi:hypothetical protein
MSPPWTPCNSRAIEAYRYLAEDAVIQLVFRRGRQVYDYPCDEAMYRAFLVASSKGEFHANVLRPHAQRLGWSRPPRPWRG